MDKRIFVTTPMLTELESRARITAAHLRISRATSNYLKRLAVGAFTLSYNTLRNISISDWQSYLWPLLVDFALIVFSLDAPGNVTAQVIAAIAPVSLFLSFELLMSLLKTEVKRHNVTLALNELTAEAEAATAERESLKSELAALRKEKRELTTNYTAVGNDTKTRALAILTERPDISGAELGRQLGKSGSLGRKLKKELGPVLAPDNQLNGNGRGEQ